MARPVSSRRPQAPETLIEVRLGRKAEFLIDVGKCWRTKQLPCAE